MRIYIAVRNMERYFTAQGMMGSEPVNTDYRLTNVRDGVYLLTREGLSFAVPRERAEEFIREVLARCTGEHPGYFPFLPGNNCRGDAAVVELRRDMESSYFDMDAGELREMLDGLRAESGEPLDERAMTNYCCPNALLPQGDHELDSVIHQICLKSGPGQKNEPAPAG